MKKTNVSNWRRTSAAVLLAMAAIGTSGASAAEQADGANRAAASKPALTVSVAHVGAEAAMLANPAHERHYWKLLVQTYAPELAPKWAEALEERKLATAGMVKKATVIREGKLPAGAGIVMVDAGEIAAANSAGSGASLQIAAPEAGLALPSRPAAERLASLAAAVEKEDAEAIRALLPKLLEDYRNDTALLRGQPRA